MAETERPLRILFTFRAPVGGLFRHVYDLVKGLVARGYQVGIVCDSTTGGARGNALLAELEPQLALGLHRLPMHRNPNGGDIAVLRRIARLVRESKPDVLHGQGAKGGLYARLQGVLSPNSGPVRCYTPHGGSLNYYPGSFLHRVYMKIEKLLERGTDLFLFESRFVQDRYHEFVTVSERPAVIALNGLYPHEFEPVVPDPDPLDFLYVGEFREAKGIDTLVEAMTLLAGRGLRPSVQMVGSGPSEERIRALIEKYGLMQSFAWRGVTPAATAFRLGRIMVVPSRFESLPYIVLEAVAGVLPLISTNVGGIPEILAADYRYLIPPNNLVVLADAMADALGRTQSDLAADARRLSDDVNEHFRVDLMVETIVAGYRHALAERR
jgi:glycosyltransferase involved in cell wall biosynthesis